MWTLFLNSLRQRALSITVYSASTAMFALMYVAMFPTIKDQSAELEKLVAAYPKGMLEAFGIEQLSFSTLEKFLAVEQYSLVWPIMAVIFVLGYSGWAIAREIELGTIEQLLSKPIARWHLYLARWLAGIKAASIFVVISVGSAIPLAIFMNIDVNYTAQLSMAILGELFLVALLSFGMMISAIVSEKGKVSLITGSVVLVMYVMNVASSLVDSLNWLRYGSFFHYIDHSAALIDATVPMESIVVFLGVAVLTTSIGLRWFNRRDIAV